MEIIVKISREELADLANGDRYRLGVILNRALDATELPSGAELPPVEIEITDK